MTIRRVNYWIKNKKLVGNGGLLLNQHKNIDIIGGFFIMSKDVCGDTIITDKSIVKGVSVDFILGDAIKHGVIVESPDVVGICHIKCDDSEKPYEISIDAIKKVY